MQLYPSGNPRNRWVLNELGEVDGALIASVSKQPDPIRDQDAWDAMSSRPDEPGMNEPRP